MKKLTALILAGIILAGCAAGYASGGTASDPLVSLRYLTDTYLPDVLRQAQEKASAAAENAYQTALNTLNVKRSGAPADQRVKRGDGITLQPGAGILLLAGSAQISKADGAVVDVTSGTAVPSGTILEAGHRCLAAEGGTVSVSVLSDTAVIRLEGDYVQTFSTETDYNALAGDLKDMGLFKGGSVAYGSGYDLERAPNRIEGIIMFLRILGEEEEAAAYTGPCPFADVPAWCQRYLAYAYAKGYTKGAGRNAAGEPLFAGETAITARDYMTFLLRAMGYRENSDFTWSTALDRGLALGLLTNGEYRLLTEQPFLRAQVVYLSCFSLSAAVQDGSGTVLDRVIRRTGLDSASAKAILAGMAGQRLS